MSESQLSPLPDKYRVRVTVKSRQQEECVEQVTEGNLYYKGGSFYLRYVEQAPAPGNVKRRSSSTQEREESVPDTTVLLKLSETEWKLTRSGAVKSEMTFTRGQARTGRYTSAVLSFPMETRTHLMERRDAPVRLENGQDIMLPAFVRWSYDLYIDERMTGLFDVQMTFEFI